MTNEERMIGVARALLGGKGTVRLDVRGFLDINYPTNGPESFTTRAYAELIAYAQDSDREVGYAVNFTASATGDDKAAAVNALCDKVIAMAAGMSATMVVSG